MEKKLYENNLERDFEKELCDKGYPTSRIVKEFGKIPYGIVDYAIVDVDYKTPIAFYEIKSKTGVRNVFVHSDLEKLILFFRKLCIFYGITIPCYLAYKEIEEEKFSVIDLTKYVGGEQLPQDIEILFDEAFALPDYRYDGSGEVKKAIRRAEAKQQRIDKIKPICWFVFPLIGLALLALDALGIYSFTPMRLIVMGAIVLIVLLPFFSEISIKDISLKRNKDKDKDNKNA